jgi:hypothetical protein
MGGTLAERNSYHFSSKEWHQKSALVYYGFRYYNPSLQRWICGFSSGGKIFAALASYGRVIRLGPGFGPGCHRRGTIGAAVLRFGDLAHGVVEGEPQDLNEEVDGVTLVDPLSLRPTHPLDHRLQFPNLTLRAARRGCSPGSALAQGSAIVAG